GIKDYAGNSLDRDYIYRFSTGNTLSTSIAGSQSLLRPGKLDVKVEGRYVHFRTAAAGLPSEARLVLSDMQGRLKREFPAAQAGEGVLWKGDDAHGHRLPSGTYVARVQTRDRILAHRAFLLP
ncbi:MAG TPA: hypothetical protein VK465_10430, partial [Fibrobacteria bacterium]|nr:hypothetical protein [Fibrobacteria bacterium]